MTHARALYDTHDGQLLNITSISLIFKICIIVFDDQNFKLCCEIMNECSYNTLASLLS